MEHGADDDDVGARMPGVKQASGEPLTQLLSLLLRDNMLRILDVVRDDQARTTAYVLGATYSLACAVRRDHRSLPFENVGHPPYNELRMANSE